MRQINTTGDLFEWYKSLSLPIVRVPIIVPASKAIITKWGFTCIMVTSDFWLLKIEQMNVNPDNFKNNAQAE